ncbi:MAG: hypothetical protein HOM34_04025 [Planctomycetes bacterium]|jgi:hypothetical protein|nr:hypothetical protein [Planctomycetota bacterium]MBT4029129.1 hypothetical protein [Planctomycetota bacterium]MBT4560507.1 hypothetical protein [Planctomycetota bacterium]MBT5100577.1 hypothetical protein [Planctomycetota bacterium]MBT5119868.1 hypothetical protein [Planctomycetota bacterium]
MNLLFLAFAAATSGGLPIAEGSVESKVMLTGLGIWMTTALWVVLIALNAWCFRKVLRHNKAISN